MTGGNMCKILQGFPILLILVQKKEICKHTPLIYEPPNHDYDYNHVMQIFSQAMAGHGSFGNSYGGYYGYPSQTYAYPLYGYGSGYEQAYYPSYYGTHGQYHSKKKGGQSYYSTKSLTGSESNKSLMASDSNGTLTDVNEKKTGDIDSPCKTPDRLPGYCRNIKKCTPMLDLVLTVRTNPEAGKYLREALCSFEGSDPIVCCPELEYQNTPENNVDFPTAKSGSLITEEEQCGVANNSFIFRVVNGQPAKLGQFPWMALLGYRPRKNTNVNQPRWLCGGTLVSHRHVITAAHCIHGRESDLYLVRLGELDLSSDDDGATPVDYNIEKAIANEKYNPSRFMNDIGIVKVSGFINFSPLIIPICLPTSQELLTKDLVGYKPFIAGWGDTQFRGPSSPTLQFLQVPIISTDICHDVYTKINKQVVIDKRQICAGFLTGRMDACQGDSGGPLMMPQVHPTTRATHNYLVGVVSFGYKCAEPGYPGIYTRVTEFLPWILDTFEK